MHTDQNMYTFSIYTPVYQKAVEVLDRKPKTHHQPKKNLNLLSWDSLIKYKNACLCIKLVQYSAVFLWSREQLVSDTPALTGLYNAYEEDCLWTLEELWHMWHMTHMINLKSVQTLVKRQVCDHALLLIHTLSYIFNLLGFMFHELLTLFLWLFYVFFAMWVLLF